MDVKADCAYYKHIFHCPPGTRLRNFNVGRSRFHLHLVVSYVILELLERNPLPNESENRRYD